MIQSNMIKPSDDPQQSSPLGYVRYSKIPISEKGDARLAWPSSKALILSVFSSEPLQWRGLPLVQPQKWFQSAGLKHSPSRWHSPPV